MSIVSHTSMKSSSPLAPRPSWEEQPAAQSPQPVKDDGIRQSLESEDRLSLGWVGFYLGCAFAISWLYYRNPGLWELIERARYWTQLVKAMY